MEYEVAVEFTGLFHAVAQPGIVLEVVVCVPLLQVHKIVSPHTAFTVEGVNEKSATEI
jgi:hypothetical protein